MLEASGLEVFVGGNIGQPLIEYVDQGMRADVIVAEISSFQLDTTESFSPKVGVLLNITEDHLDRYTNFQGYVRSKGKLFVNQESRDIAILNRADSLVRSLESTIRAKKLYFNMSADEPLDGAQIRGEEITCSLSGKNPITLSLARFKARGVHNMENAAAASLAAYAGGGVEPGIQRALDTFEGMHHRLEYVRTVNGVAYYNDSKATNVGAVVRALESFDIPVTLIMGGRDKGGSYALLEGLVIQRVRRLIAIGEARKKILDALGGLTASQEATSIEEAVYLAAKGGSPGDVVLLSPGCSSFDMFTDYAERGDAYRRTVEGL
jgi:UDP-N-acetylmuramoylalanine--D-glutamate ligase